MLSMLIDMHMLLAPFVLILQMHTDMGDERGIRLRCICLGRAAPRGSRMRGMGRCGKGSESRIARSSLSIARSSVCAAVGVCVLTSPFTKQATQWQQQQRRLAGLAGYCQVKLGLNLAINGLSRQKLS